MLPFGGPAHGCVLYLWMEKHGTQRLDGDFSPLGHMVDGLVDGMASWI